MDQGEPSEGKTAGGGERAGAQTEAERCEGAHRQPGVFVRLPGAQAQEGRLLRLRGASSELLNPIMHGACEFLASRTVHRIERPFLLKIRF